MEMYTNAKAADRVVYLDFPVMATAIDVWLYVDDIPNGEISTVTPVVVGDDVEGYQAMVPFYLLQTGKNIQLRWTISFTESGGTQTVRRTQNIEVVEPILSKTEIREIDPHVFSSDDEIVKIEKAVRHIVQAYTGQQFGRYTGSVRVKAVGGLTLRLPRRLIRIERFDGRPANNLHFEINDNGYTLKHYDWGVPPVKADYYGLHMHTGGVIHNPNAVKWKQFAPGRHYEVYGEWGWEEIPAGVKEAAKLLVNDYACADSQYRDRYLTSMTAADWRIQFHSGAFARTGNVRADQLLSEYVTTRGWGVI